MAKPNNFILSGKGLVLDLNPKDLDWEMLKFSKTINSKKGGWNFKKYYLDALEGMLTWDNGIFKTITTNTTVPQSVASHQLGPSIVPLIRTHLFRLFSSLTL